MALDDESKKDLSYLINDTVLDGKLKKDLSCLLDKHSIKNLNTGYENMMLRIKDLYSQLLTKDKIIKECEKALRRAMDSLDSVDDDMSRRITDKERSISQAEIQVAMADIGKALDRIAQMKEDN